MFNFKSIIEFEFMIYLVNSKNQYFLYFYLPMRVINLVKLKSLIYKVKFIPLDFD